MKIVAIVFLFYVSVYACWFERTKRTAEEIEWGYEGDIGPEHWGWLKPEWKQCTIGLKQTPIPLGFPASFDFVKPYLVGELVLEDESVEGIVQNNGHTIIVFPNNNVASVSGSSLLGDKFHLIQFHWHAPSEHTFNGSLLPMEVHFVHEHVETKDKAVIAVMYQVGSKNQWLKHFFKDIPQSPAQERAVDHFHPYAGIPHFRRVGEIFSGVNYLYYDGSFSTPPCTEGVKWFVSLEPDTISEEQLSTLQGIYNMNSRPLQDVHGRTVWMNTASSLHCRNPSNKT